jgi:hypothetical protein
MIQQFNIGEESVHIDVHNDLTQIPLGLYFYELRQQTT